MTDIERLCFVVMPFGRDQLEQRWYRGWYQVVLQSAIQSAGFTPFLSAAHDSPDAINDEIRRHLALDPMVVVDLGGAGPEDPPNPNVMYELGIRHAFGLPVVLLAWEGQRLPFDISNQRALTCSRDLLDIEPTKARLRSFLLSAASGQFYNPMAAVGRQAALQAATEEMEPDSILKTLVAEIEDLRRDLPKAKYIERERTKISEFISRKRAERLRQRFYEYGIPLHLWERLLDRGMPGHLRADAPLWDDESWLEFLKGQALMLSRAESSDLVATGSAPQGTFTADQETIDRVAELLPTQPWPRNIHKLIAAKLSLPNSVISRAINELIKQGRFLPQIQGVVYAPMKEDSEEGKPENG